MIIGHGGNKKDLAKTLGCSVNDIIDMSSNLNPLGTPETIEKVICENFVKIKSLPASLKPDIETSKEKYNPIELEDLSSLAKLSFGYEEAPFPLFAFKQNDKWFMGVFLNFNEDGPSYFCHVSLDEEPTKPFLKYTTSKNSEPEFVNHTGDHGYSYIKIIKLKDSHPLVDYDQIQ